MTDLLRRAWDALDTFKQAYPENWHDEDEQVLQDLMRADMKLSGVQLKWVGMTDEEKEKFVVAYYASSWDRKTAVALMNNYERLLKEKNA